MRDKLKITVSAVAIGGEVDVPLLKRIAQYGGGLFHHTYNPTTLPQIVLQQIQEKPQEEPLVEGDFIPVPVKGSELLAGFPVRSYPLLKGYIETEVKREAHLDLMTIRGERRAPLLASWSYGKGKAVAFAADLDGRWSREWIQWEGLERFWDKVFEWLRPIRKSLPPHEARMNLRGGRPVLDLYLYDEADEDSLFRYSFQGKGAQGEGMLTRLAQGHYQATLSLAAPGDYQIRLIQERRGERIPYPTLGYTPALDPKAEIPQGDFNIPLLERLALASGGEINPAGVESLKSRETIRTSVSLRPHLIFLALTLFLLEIVTRGFFFSATS